MGYKHNASDVIAAGSALIQRDGYHAVGINQILQAAGVPKGSFYNFFRSKADFARAILDAYGEEYGTWVRQLLREADGSPLERVLAFYRALVDANEADEFARGCLVANLSNEVARASDELAAVCDRNFRLLIAGTTEVLADAQAAGEVRRDFTAARLAEYLHAGFYGQFPRMKATRSRASLDDWLAMSERFLRGT